MAKQKRKPRRKTRTRRGGRGKHNGLPSHIAKKYGITKEAWDIYLGRVYKKRGRKGGSYRLNPYM